MKKTLLPLLAIAFCVALVCTGLFYTLVVGRVGLGAKASVERKVVVAARTLERGAKVGPTDVRVISWSGSQPPAGSYSMSTQVEGLMVVQQLGANEPLTNTTVMSPDTGGGLGVPSGMRAVSVTVADILGVPGMLKPGYRVDVQAIYGGGPSSEIRTVLQNIEVLKTESKGDGRGGGTVLTALVTPQEADVLSVAESAGKLRLALRNPLDQERRDRASLIGDSLMRGRSAQPAVLASPGPVPATRPSPAPAQVSKAAAAPVIGLSPLGLQAQGAACNPPAKDQGKSSEK